MANYQKQIVNESLMKFVSKLLTNWKCLKSLEEYYENSCCKAIHLYCSKAFRKLSLCSSTSDCGARMVMDGA